MDNGRKNREGQQKLGGIAGWLLSRWRRRAGTQARLALIDRITLAPRQTLCLVEAEGQQVLVATSPEGAAFYPLIVKALCTAHSNRSIAPGRRASW